MMKLITITFFIFICFTSTTWAQGWQAIQSPVEDDITGIIFIHPDTGFLVTKNGRFARTYDGAKTWKTSTVTSDSRLEDLSFLDATHGVVCGSRGAIFRTTDAGQTWENVSPGDSVHMFYEVQLIDARVGLITGMDRGEEFPYAGIALRTTDGGKTWKEQECTGMGFSEIYYKPGGDIFFPAFGQLMRSSDKGITWQTIKMGIEGRARALTMYGNVALMVGPESMCAISTDSGKTWSNIKLDGNNTLVAAELINEQVGYIGGLQSKMLFTSDGGQTWNKELLARSFSVLDMCLIKDRLYAVGTEGAMIYKIVAP